MQKLIMTVIAICGLSFVALAENKDAKSETPTKSEAGSVYYWFPADPSGALTSHVAKSPSPSELDPQCQGGGDICGLSFNENDTELNGSLQRVLKTDIDEGDAVGSSRME